MTPDDMEAVVERLQLDATGYRAAELGTISVGQSDLRALLLDYQERGRALERLVESVAYAETDGGRRSYGLKPCFGTAYQEARATLKGKSHD